MVQTETSCFDPLRFGLEVAWSELEEDAYWNF